MRNNCGLMISWALAGLLAGFAAGGDALAQAAKFPEIRLSQRNAVPACVTPDRLMAFLGQRNENLDPRFRSIAHYYKQHGEAWRVRWDYAFFQMAIETNFLTYRRPNGRMGDVDPRQNNFAGIGTTGGGVPGDSFPDVSTGVLGQIQHLVVYSGEMVDNPVASRTRLKQEHILALSRKLNRPVLWSDLARRWAVDPKYASSIEWVAGRYREQFCGRNAPPPAADAERLPWQNSDAGGAEPAVRTAAIGLPLRKTSSSETPTAAALTAPGPTAPVVEEGPPVPLVQPAPKAAPSEGAPVVASANAGGGGLTSVFALFSPPEGFLGALEPEADSSGRSIPQPVIDQPTTAGATVPAMSPDGQTAASDPQTVAAPSVGGFVIADAGRGAKPPFDPPSGLGVKPPGRCVIETASYGGETTVLVRTQSGVDTRYVALSVLDGFEDTMTRSFLSAQPGGGAPLGTYPSRDAALAEARTLCPQEG